MSKMTNRIITALFSVFIGGFFLLNLLLPDKDFSEKENRQLQTLPKFSFSSLFSGSFVFGTGFVSNSRSCDINSGFSQKAVTPASFASSSISDQSYAVRIMIGVSSPRLRI